MSPADRFAQVIGGAGSLTDAQARALLTEMLCLRGEMLAGAERMERLGAAAAAMYFAECATEQEVLLRELRSRLGSRFASVAGMMRLASI